MSTAQHTPGPWKVFSVFADAEVRANDGTLIAVVPGRPGVRNARLIATAPELLTALRDLESAVTNAVSAKTAGAEQVALMDLVLPASAARRVIAKATGAAA